MKTALIIFTKNERENLEVIFKSIPIEIFDNIYAIDGKSTDGTLDFFKTKKIKVFPQKYKGVGGAYESAFKNTREDALIFFHPDGNMNPKDLGEFINALKTGGEFIVATRMVKGATNEEDNQILKPRKWFCLALGLCANILWGGKGNQTTDITQGYRSLTRKAYGKLRISIPDPVAPDFEQVIRALKNGIKIVEFPTREGKRIHGWTSMTSLKTGLANIKILLKELVE